MTDRPALLSAKTLGLVLKLSSLVPFATGFIEVLAAPRILIALGAAIPPGTAVDPVLISQLAFGGAMWFGFGFALWWCSGDVARRASILRILLFMLFLAGLGRALAWIRFGWLGPLMTGVMLFEIGSAILLYAWLSAVERVGARRP